jgi:SM-20-related protein
VNPASAGARRSAGAVRVPVDADFAADLLGAGLAVWPGFLDPAALGELADCARRRHERGEFRAARVGSGATLRRDQVVRGDSICWLAQPYFPAETRVLAALERLRLELNRQGMLGLFDAEFQYALYPPGAAYARHVDQPLGRGQRRVSLVLYLNPGWPADAGGALRIHAADGSHRDVPPDGGLLVAFATPGREHEVLPARQTRWSLSGWLRTRA